MTAVPTSEPRFETLQAPPGVHLVDPIDGGQFTLLTPEPVECTPSSTDALPIPVDGAVSLDTDIVRTPYLVGVWIRDAAFDLVAQCTGGDEATFDPDSYVVEFSSVQLKLYLGIEGSFSVDATGDYVELSFPEATEVIVGIRSYHEQPARTITTTDDIDDVMTALSQFRAALKTTSPERSFPTLRGHPPLLERGDELSIPGSLLDREPSVSIEVPARWNRVLPVAPLAYYLDADIREGTRPRLVADGRSIPLDGPDGFERRVARILRHVFTLDCVTRTEGLYNVDLHERSVIEERTTLDFEALYDQSLGERTGTYLDVPFEVVEPASPEWKLTADVQPEVENVPVLPFLAADLAEIRCPRHGDITPRVLEDTSPDVESFFREEPVLVRGPSSAVRSESATSRPSVEDRVFRPQPTDSLMQTFVGDGIPMGATKMTLDAFERRLDYEPTESGRIRVDVVNNEEAMSDESVVSDVYGAREWIDFDVTIHDELTQNELAAVLQEETDFFHYIGHVEDEGFRCTDGHLDARSLSDVGVGAFLLNACNSYEQGHTLVDAGALGGIVTLANIPNPTATSIGMTLVRLLNIGFSLSTARALLEKDEQLASRYMVVGDGHANIVESQLGSPVHMELQSVESDVIKLSIQGYPISDIPNGSLRDWHFEPFEENCLMTACLERIEMTSEEFERLCENGDFPVLYEEQLVWSEEILSRL
ncbi:hypothetical protein [Halorhabdus amylolytica]|uniref:hypothetical protein n=1 Tax=Halorhabdus amylolytica TaxID=2559573 RepID=UPI0010AA0571|nr:hypothetical protein [Halorhabdus amylolytica]